MQNFINLISELKAPKGQENRFGGYKYRSAEDILEAVKPLLKKHNCLLTISDRVELIGDRYYVVATATMTDGTATISNTAYAREEETRKGMDASQLTGSCSSYARKYALNGLLLIDDTKDSDDERVKSEAWGKIYKELIEHSLDEVVEDDEKSDFKAYIVQNDKTGKLKPSDFLIKAGWKLGDAVTYQILIKAYKIFNQKAGIV